MILLPIFFTIELCVQDWAEKAKDWTKVSQLAVMPKGASELMVFSFLVQHFNY